MKKSVILFILLAIFFISCSKKEYFVEKDVYYKGISMYKKGKYGDAKKYLKKAIYKGKGLTTKELMEARYYLANIYYRKKKYIDAIVEFEEFLSIFPASPYTAEVLYKLADSYLKVAPDPNKDLTYARKALERAEELVAKYPNSVYVKKAQEIIRKVKNMEIKHYYNIATLYEKLGKYYGAARYYQFIINEYGDFIDKNKTEFLKAKNLARLKDQYKKEIKKINKEQERIRKKIAKTNNSEEKKVLKNRLKLHEEYKKILLERIKRGREEAKKILEKLKTNPKYKKLAENLLKEVK